jgi:hypothetical protein
VTLPDHESVRHEIRDEARRGRKTHSQERAQIFDPETGKSMDPEKRLHSGVGRIDAPSHRELDGVRKPDRESAKQVDRTRLGRARLLVRRM